MRFSKQYFFFLKTFFSWTFFLSVRSKYIFETISVFSTIKGKFWYRIPAFFNYLKSCRQSIMWPGWRHWRCPKTSSNVQSQCLRNLEWQESALMKSSRSIKKVKAFIHRTKYSCLRKLKHKISRKDIRSVKILNERKLIDE